MYKIIKTEFFLLKIRNFIKSYLNKNLNLFIDTGIENENLILETYLNSSKIFKEKIFYEVEKYFSEDFLVKKFGKNGKYLAIISVGNFRLFVEYTENIDEKTRFLEDIEIYKK